MDTRQVIDRYYELANAGAWDDWCDLFSADTRMDGRETLRAMMKGFPETYASFTNRPRHVVVSDATAAVVSHISGRTRHGDSVEADVCNYFEIADGHITYMANFHDTVPFRPVLSGG
jgi:ketosteroid isomerase-like protein